MPGLKPLRYTFPLIIEYWKEHNCVYFYASESDQARDNNIYTWSNNEKETFYGEICLSSRDSYFRTDVPDMFDFPRCYNEEDALIVIKEHWLKYKR